MKNLQKFPIFDNLYKIFDICTKMCYFVGMIHINNRTADREQSLMKVCQFLKIERDIVNSSTTEEAIKEVCVARLCKAIGVSGVYDYKSEFFNFFGCVMGEALCEKLSIKLHIASAELRLVKYEHVNLIDELRFYLDNEPVEEAFLDAFHFLDKFKYLIPKLKL